MANRSHIIFNKNITINSLTIIIIYSIVVAILIKLTATIIIKKRRYKLSNYVFTNKNNSNESLEYNWFDTRK